MNIFLLFALFSFQVLSSEKQILNVGYVDFPPLSFKKKNNQADGIVINHYKDLFIDSNVQVNFTHIPVKRVIPFIENGQVDIILAPSFLKLDPARVHKIKHEGFSIHINIYSLTPFPKQFSMQSLKNQSVVAIDGYTYSGKRKFLEDPYNKIQLTNVSKTKNAIKFLLAKRSKYFIAYSAEINSVKNKPKKLYKKEISTHKLNYFINKNYKYKKLIEKIILK